MARLLASTGYEVHIIEWDREDSKPRTEIEKGILFNRLRLKAGYGLAAFHLVPVWIVFAFIQIVVGNYRIVQPQNLDCLIPTFLATLLGRDTRIVYDLADFYGDYVADIPIVNSACVMLERVLIRNVDVAILVSERQTLQVRRQNLPEKVILFYNMPTLDSCKLDLKDRKPVSTFSLFYAGILSVDRVNLLLNVAQAIEGLRASLVVAGFGASEHSIRQLSLVNKQVVFLGKLDHEKVMEFTKTSDIALLPYNPTRLNNRIGLPNKFFESMGCGTLMLVQRDTYIGEIVEREGIGIVIDFTNLEEIRRVVESVINSKGNDIQLLKDKARQLYVEKFDPRKISDKYVDMVKILVSK